MINKKELQSKIEDLEKQVTELKEQVNSIDEIKINKRWCPEHEEIYFYLGGCGIIRDVEWLGNDKDTFNFDIGNCFKTRQEAEGYMENLLTKQRLKDLALELNNGVEIDWDNDEQPKYFIHLDYEDLELRQSYSYTSQQTNIVCRDSAFLYKALERIGEEKLIKLIKSGV